MLPPARGAGVVLHRGVERLPTAIDPCRMSAPMRAVAKACTVVRSALSFNQIAAYTCKFATIDRRRHAGLQMQRDEQQDGAGNRGFGTGGAMSDASELSGMNLQGPGLMRPTASAAPHYLDRIAVRSVNRIVIVRVAGIARLEAEDNYVRIWADRLYLHKDTLSGLVAKLDPARFLRVHRSHAINIELVHELRPQLRGEYSITLSDGTVLTSGRSYRSQIQAAFGLA